MKRSLKLMMATLSALAVPVFGWAAGESISFYVNSGYGDAYDADTKYGWDTATADGANWNALSDSVILPKDNTGAVVPATSVTVNAKGGAWVHTAPAQLGSASRGYYDGQWNLDLKGIPYSEYKVVLFMATDNSGKTWGPVKVTSGGTETYYAYDADKNLTTEGVTAGTSWGTTGNNGSGYAALNGTEGVDVMVIPGLSGDINLLTHGTSHEDTTRGGLFAMQIINTSDVIAPCPTATITEDIAASELTWAPTEPSAETVAVFDVLASGTLTMDEAITAKTLSIVGNEALTIKDSETLTADFAIIATDTDISEAVTALKAITIQSGKTLTVAQPFGDDVTLTRRANSILKITGDTTTLPLADNTVTETTGNLVLEGVGEMLKGRAWKLSGGESSAAFVYLASGADWGNPGSKSYLTMTNGAKLTVTGDAATIGRTTTDGAVMFAECSNGSEVSITGEGTALMVPNGALNLSRDGVSTATVSDGALLQAYKLGGTSNYSTLTIRNATLKLGKEGATDGVLTMTSCKLSLENATLTAAGDWAIAADSTASSIEVKETLTVDPAGKTITLRNLTLAEGASIALTGTGTLILPAGMEGTMAIPDSAQLKLVVTSDQIAMGYTSAVTAGTVTFISEDGTTLTDADGVNGNTIKRTNAWTGNGGDTAWDNDANWTSGVPTDKDNPEFNLADDLEIVIPEGGATVGTLTVAGKQLTLTGGTLNAEKAIVTSTLKTAPTGITTAHIDLGETGTLILDTATTTEGQTADLTTKITGGTVIKTGAGVAKLGQPADGSASPILDGTVAQINEGGLKLVIADGDPWVKNATFEFADGTSLQQYGWVHAIGTVTLNAEEGVTASAFGTNLAESSTTLRKTGAGRVEVTVSNYPGTVKVEGGTLVHKGGTLSGTITTAADTTLEITANASIENADNAFNGLLKVTGGTTIHNGKDRGLNSIEVAADATLQSSAADGLNYNGTTTATINGTLHLKKRWTIFAGNTFYVSGTLASDEANSDNSNFDNYYTAYDFYNHANDDSEHAKVYVTGSGAKITGLWGAHGSSKTVDIVFNTSGAKLTIAAAPTGSQHIATSLAEGITGGTLALDVAAETEKMLRIGSGVTFTATATWGGVMNLSDGAILDATNVITVGGAVTTDGAVTVTNVTAADTPVLTYSGEAPADVEEVYIADGYTAYATSINGYTSIAFTEADDGNESVTVPEGTTDEEFDAAWAVLQGKLTDDELDAITEITNPDAATIINGCGVDLDETGTIATLTYDLKVTNIAFDADGDVSVTVSLGEGQTFIGTLFAYPEYIAGVQPESSEAPFSIRVDDKTFIAEFEKGEGTQLFKIKIKK